MRSTLLRGFPGTLKVGLRISLPLGSTRSEAQPHLFSFLTLCVYSPIFLFLAPFVTRIYGDRVFWASYMLKIVFIADLKGSLCFVVEADEFHGLRFKALLR